MKLILCVCAVTDAQDHPDPHPHLQVVSAALPQQCGGPQPGDRTHHHPGHPREGGDHRCEL